MLGLSLFEHFQLPVTSLTRLPWEEHRNLPHSLDTVPNIPTTIRPRAKPQTLEASWSVLVNGVHQCFVPILIHSVTMKNREESERDSLLPWPYDLLCHFEWVILPLHLFPYLGAKRAERGDLRGSPGLGTLLPSHLPPTSTAGKSSKCGASCFYHQLLKRDDCRWDLRTHQTHFAASRELK